MMTNLASYFAENGCDVVLTTLYEVKNEYKLSQKVKRIIIHGAEVSYEDLAKSSGLERIKRIAGRLLKLRKVIKREKPDLLVAFMGANNIGAILASMGLKTKTIISVRSMPSDEYPGAKGRVVSRFILPLASGCVFQTDEAKKWFSLKLQNKSAVILNPVKIDFFNVKRNPVNAEIATFGRLIPLKNHLKIMDAVNELHKKYLDLNLKIYGDGPLRGKLEEHIKALNANDFIKLMGNIKNVPEALSSAEIFVLNSDFEGMPNALMEAMAAGLPCISTDCPCGGPKSLIKDMQNGILIPVGDYDALLKNIEFLLKNKDKAKIIGENARKSALKFTPDKIYHEWEKYFKDVLSR